MGISQRELINLATWEGLDPEAVAFDLYGTLLSMEPLRRLVAARYPGPGAQLAARWLANQEEHAWVRTLAGAFAPMDVIRTESLNAAAAEVGLGLSPMSQRRLLQAQLTPPPIREAKHTLAALAAERPLAVLSNGSPAMLQAALEASGLAPYFTHVVSAEQVQRYKPAPEPYQALAAAVGHPPERVLFVTAHGWDLLGAAAVGLRTAWLNPGALPPEYAGLRPDLTLASLTELIPGAPRLA